MDTQVQVRIQVRVRDLEIMDDNKLPDKKLDPFPLYIGWKKV